MSRREWTIISPPVAPVSPVPAPPLSLAVPVTSSSSPTSTAPSAPPAPINPYDLRRLVFKFAEFANVTDDKNGREQLLKSAVEYIKKNQEEFSFFNLDLSNKENVAKLATEISMFVLHVKFGDYNNDKYIAKFREKVGITVPEDESNPAEMAWVDDPNDDNQAQTFFWQRLCTGLAPGQKKESVVGREIRASLDPGRLVDPETVTHGDEFANLVFYGQCDDAISHIRGRLDYSMLQQRLQKKRDEYNVETDTNEQARLLAEITEIESKLKPFDEQIYRIEQLRGDGLNAFLIRLEESRERLRLFYLEDELRSKFEYEAAMVWLRDTFSDKNFTLEVEKSFAEEIFLLHPELRKGYNPSDPNSFAELEKKCNPAERLRLLFKVFSYTDSNNKGNLFEYYKKHDGGYDRIKEIAEEKLDKVRLDPKGPFLVNPDQIRFQSSFGDYAANMLLSPDFYLNPLLREQDDKKLQEEIAAEKIQTAFRERIAKHRLTKDTAAKEILLTTNGTISSSISFKEAQGVSASASGHISFNPFPQVLQKSGDVIDIKMNLGNGDEVNMLQVIRHQKPAGPTGKDPIRELYESVEWLRQQKSLGVNVHLVLLEEGVGPNPATKECLIVSLPGAVVQSFTTGFLDRQKEEAQRIYSKIILPHLALMHGLKSLQAVLHLNLTHLKSLIPNEKDCERNPEQAKLKKELLEKISRLQIQTDGLDKAIKRYNFKGSEDYLAMQIKAEGLQEYLRHSRENVHNLKSPPAAGAAKITSASEIFPISADLLQDEINIGTDPNDKKIIKPADKIKEIETTLLSFDSPTGISTAKETTDDVKRISADFTQKVVNAEMVRKVAETADKNQFTISLNDQEKTGFYEKFLAARSGKISDKEREMFRRRIDELFSLSFQCPVDEKVGGVCISKAPIHDYGSKLKKRKTSSASEIAENSAQVVFVGDPNKINNNAHVYIGNGMYINVSLKPDGSIVFEERPYIRIATKDGYQYYPKENVTKDDWEQFKSFSVSASSVNENGELCAFGMIVDGLSVTNLPKDRKKILGIKRDPLPETHLDKKLAPSFPQETKAQNRECSFDVKITGGIIPQDCDDKGAISENSPLGTLITNFPNVFQEGKGGGNLSYSKTHSGFLFKGQSGFIPGKIKAITFAPISEIPESNGKFIIVAPVFAVEENGKIFFEVGKPVIQIVNFDGSLEYLKYDSAKSDSRFSYEQKKFLSNKKNYAQEAAKSNVNVILKSPAGNEVITVSSGDSLSNPKRKHNFGDNPLHAAQAELRGGLRERYRAGGGVIPLAEFIVGADGCIVSGKLPTKDKDDNGIDYNILPSGVNNHNNTTIAFTNIGFVKIEDLSVILFGQNAEIVMPVAVLPGKKAEGSIRRIPEPMVRVFDLDGKPRYYTLENYQKTIERDPEILPDRKQDMKEYLTHNEEAFKKACHNDIAVRMIHKDGSKKPDHLILREMTYASANNRAMKGFVDSVVAHVNDKGQYVNDKGHEITPPTSCAATHAELFDFTSRVLGSGMAPNGQLVL